MTAGRPPRRRGRKASAPPGSGTPRGTPKEVPDGGTGRGGSATGHREKGKTPRSSKTRTEVSAGGVVYRREPDGLEVILAARRTRRGELAWGLAKGGIEADESTEEAAVRIRKTVHFFLMRATGGDPNDRDDEMEDVQWFPLERALKRAAYRGEREVLGRAAEILR